MELAKFQEQVFFSVTRISTANSQIAGTSIGTGFIVEVKLSQRDDEHILLLISNRHVLQDPSHKVEVVVHQKNASGSGPDLGRVFNVAGSNYSNFYVPHPDPAIDLACVYITAIADQQHNLYYRTLPVSMLADFSESDLLPGKEVWFVGYPDGRFDQVHNLPLLRRGYISSIPKVDFNGQPVFVVDAQVFPGSSGSPVFAEIGRQFKLLGVISQTMVRNQSLQIVTAQSVGVQMTIGLGLVIKAARVRDLINQAEAEFYTRFGADQIPPRENGVSDPMS